MAKFWATCLVVFLSLTAFCQSNAVYPDLLSAYFYNMASIHVGYIPTNGTADFAVGYKFHEGQLKKVNTLSFAGAKVFRSNKGNAQAIRVLGYNEQNGPYISSPKGYLNYAYEVKLGEESHLFAGIALGAAGIYFSAPTFSGSTWMPDGSLGVGFRFRTLSAGASTLQMFNSGSSQLGDTYRLGRFYHFYAAVEQELGLDWKCNGYALWRKLGSSGDDLGAALSITAREVFTLGTSLRYKAGMSFFTAFHIDAGENKLLLSLNYNAAPIFTSLPTWQNSFEISVGYTLE